MSLKMLTRGMILAAMLAAPAVAQASTFVPYTSSDTATFRNIRFSTSSDLEIDRESGNWKHYKNFAGFGAVWVWAHPSAERIYVYSQTKGTYQLMVDFDEQVGASHRIDVGSCNNGDVVLGAKGLTVQTKAGTFDGCVRLDLRTSCADGGTTGIWFKAGVGIVKWTESNITGSVTVELEKGNIGGVAYPKPVSALKLSAEFPKPEAFINLMPSIGGPRPPAKIAAKISLENKTGADMSFVFNSGQSFEIELIDSGNKVVARWSNGRAFTFAIRQLTLKNGETWTFGGELELKTLQGAVVPEGNYTLQIRITSNPARYAATAPIQISHVY